MAWAAPKTWVAGETLTASDFNTQLRDNFKYLKGQAGTLVDIEDALKTEGDLSVVGNVSAGWNGSAYTLTHAAGVLSAGLRDTENGTMRVVRHPYAAAEHLERGIAAGVPSTGASVTFTDAYSAGPVIVATPNAWTTNNNPAITAASSTGFTIGHGDGSSFSYMWVAIGSEV